MGRLGLQREKTHRRPGINSHEVETTFATLILSGVLERFPGLKVVSAELNCGWLPFFLFRVDERFERPRRPLSRQPFPTKLKLKPSEYFRRQLYATFIDDSFGIAHRHDIGVDNCFGHPTSLTARRSGPIRGKKSPRIFKTSTLQDQQKILWQNTGEAVRL